jgi:hypothetical protein
MNPTDYPVAAMFGNDTSEDISLHLEMLAEEVILAPGHRVELLARPSPDLLPISVHQVEGGLQVFPNKEFDPDWHVRFNGRVIRAGHPLRLADYD